MVAVQADLTVRWGRTAPRGTSVGGDRQSKRNGTDDAMGPLLWWWRWWLGDDPNGDRQLTEARGLLDEQRTQSDELAGLVQNRDRELKDLRERGASLERRRGEADEARAQLAAELDQARSDADEARAQLAAELDQARSDADEVRARLTAELDQARDRKSTRLNSSHT